MKPLILREFAFAVESISVLTGIVEQAEKISPAAASRWASMLDGPLRSFQGLGLNLSAIQAQKIKRDLLYIENPGPSDILAMLRELANRYEDELRECHCFTMTAEKVRYWRTPQLFGSEVSDRFPSAIIDIEEAGKCLACNRGTAAVFHLMRVMEAGLKATAKALGIPYAPSWESYLAQIQSQLDKKWKTKRPKWKADEPFFRDAHGYLHAVKIAWRNPTMHIVNHYTPEVAEEVYNAVRGFMRHLATKLSE